MSPISATTLNALTTPQSQVQTAQAQSIDPQGAPKTHRHGHGHHGGGQKPASEAAPTTAPAPSANPALGNNVNTSA